MVKEQNTQNGLKNAIIFDGYKTTLKNEMEAKEDGFTVGIFVALLIFEFFVIRIDMKLCRIIDLLNGIKNKEA